MKLNIIAFMQSESYLIRMQTTTTMMAIIKMMLAAEPITPPIMAPVFPLSSTKRTQINTSITINIKDFFYHRKSKFRKYIETSLEML